MMANDPGERATRQRILDAAMQIAHQGDRTRMSVRVVATRAGVGMGTLRHHFPTQRELLDAVFAALYDQVLPDDRIRDASIPASQRLIECCRQILGPIGLDDHARQVWTEIFRAFIAPDAPADQRAGYLELRRQTETRVEGWLSILVEEGALLRGDNSTRARFLLAVLDGLGLQRALPSSSSTLDLENAVLETAIASLSTVGLAVRSMAPGAS